MSLLREIQDGATEDTVSLGSLLRKTKLLAARIGVKEIGEWAERELSGYNNNNELPPYRGPFEATVLGNAIDPYRGFLQNFPIPPIALSENVRNGFLFKLHFTQGVTELESLAAVKETLRDPWPSDAVAAFSILTEGGIAKIDPSMAFVEIWKPIPYPVIVGVLDAIRTRLLDLTMQLGEEEPLAERGQRLPDPNHAANILYTVVYADTANVAVGNRDVTQTQTQQLPAPFDTVSLLDYLRKLGLDDEVIDNLQNALEEDAEEEGECDDSSERKGPGRRTLMWLKNVLTATTTKVGTPVATTLITQALLHHFGI
jgi:hypothetical protein